MPVRALLMVLLLVGCGSATTPSPPAEDGGVVGGTLRVGLWIPGDADDFERRLLDPQLFFWHPFARCCLLRTLLTYEGRPIEDGGAQLRPDLAETMPEVSSDGLTWTFRIRKGMRYAPPFEDRHIVAGDFITALERTVRVGESPYHDVIEGVSEFRAGEAGTIAGAQAPDDWTIEFRLTEPAGDFGNRVAMPYLAPIPEEALAVHGDEYGGYVVASGPYMIEGGEMLDHGDAQGAPTYLPDDLVLVRNPSWSRELDSNRPAYADRIEVLPIEDRGTEAIDSVASGEMDIVLDPLTPAARAEAAADPQLRLRLREVPNPVLFFIPLNVAQPPFDDVNVRRAVNAIIDRDALLPTFDPERGSHFVATSHAFPDVAVGGLLRDYAPADAATSGGDVDGAREIMARSAYDADADGRCDGEACTVAANRIGSTSDLALGIIAEGLAELGIEVEWVDEPQMFDPTGHIGLGAIFGWVADYPSANDFVILMGDPGPETLNPSLLGATPEQLEEWGYAAGSVPSVDDKVGLCTTLGGSAAFACWAELDQMLTEQVVPWVPVARSLGAHLLGEDVDRFDFSGSEQMPALDRISVRRSDSP